MSLILPALAQACAAGDFAPPQKQLELTGRTRMLVTWDGTVERFVVDLKYRGDTEDFGLVFALPARPNVEEAAEELFVGLAAYTRPLPRKTFTKIDVGLSFGDSRATASYDTGVTVLEEKAIGDFDVTILNATDDRALIAWLTDRDFTIPARDATNIRAIVGRGGATFVAVQVNATRARFSRGVSGVYDTPPLAFAFRPSHPVIPLRLAADDDPVQRFSVYTIGSVPQVVPGAGLVFSGRLPRRLTEEYQALSPYTWPGAQLIRMEVMIDPSRITEDLALVPWDAPTAERVRFGDSLTLLMPARAQATAGVIAPQDDVFIGRFVVDEDDDADLRETRAYRVSEYRQAIAYDVIRFVIVLLPFLLAHIITALALHALARHRAVRAGWLAWFPFLNGDLVRRIAQVPRWWGISSTMIPVTLLLFVWGFSRLSYGSPIIATLVMAMIVVFIVQAVWWVRLGFALARSYGRSRWWGAAMAIPFLGAIPLAVMARRVRDSIPAPTQSPDPGGVA